MKRPFYCWPTIQSFYDEGHGMQQCRGRFRFSVQSWYKAIARGRLKLRPLDATLLESRRAGNSRYAWDAVQLFYDEGHTFRECMAKFGFTANTWSSAVQRGNIVSRPRARPLQHILALSNSRLTIKRRLLQAGILTNRCDECEIVEWRGRPISIQLDHRNGVKDDHRLENLRMLCPNCHSQTETFAAKNMKKRRSRVV